MASLYWYRPANGNGNWNTITDWYFGSGGTGGVSSAIPTTADDVFLDAASGSGILTTSAGAGLCNSINMNGFTGTFAGTSGMSITTTVAPPGNVIITLGGNITSTGLWTVNTTITNNMTFDFRGLSLNGNFTLDTGPNVYTCISDFRIGGTLTLTAGTFTCGSNNLYCGSLSSSNTSTRSITAANLYLTGTGALLTLTTTTGLTFDIPNVYANNASGTAKTITFGNGFSFKQNVYIQGAGTGGWTIAGGTGNFTRVYIQVTGNPTISFSTGQYNNIEFTPGTICRWTNAASQTITLNVWQNLNETIGVYVAASVTSITLSPAITFVMVTYTYTSEINLNGKSLVTGTVTLNGALFNLNTPLVSTGGLTLTNAASLNVYENITVSALTITSGNFNIKTNDLSIIVSGTMTLTAGTINDAAPGINLINFTCAAFASTGTGIRTMGYVAGNNINFTVTGSAATNWNLAATNFTFSGSNINIRFTNTTLNTVTFAGGGKSYNIVRIDRGGGGGAMTFTGSNTFYELSDNSTATHTLQFTAGTTNTFTYFLLNTGPGNTIQIIAPTIATFNLVKSGPGVVSIDYALIRNSSASPANTWFAGVNSTDDATTPLNTGWVFTSPTTPSNKVMALLGIG